MSIEGTLNSIVSTAQSVAAQYSQKAASYAGTATTAGNGYSYSTPKDIIKHFEFEAPAYQPGEDLSAYYKSLFDELWKDFDDDLTAKMQQWMDTYFPHIDDCITTSSDAWICDTINGLREIGLPAHVVDGMWLAGRERVIADTQRQENKVVSQYAAMGFSLPGSVLAAQLAEAQRDAQTKLSEHNLGVTIEAAKIAVEVEKFAVEMAVKLRLGVAQQMAAMVQAWIGLYKAAADAAGTAVDAKAKLYSSAASWISAMSNRAQALGAPYADDAKTYATVGMANAQVFQKSIEAQVQGASHAAKAMGDIAAAALAAQHTMGNLNYVENKEL